MQQVLNAARKQILAVLVCVTVCVTHLHTSTQEPVLGAATAGWTCVQLMMMMCSSRGPHTLKHTNTEAIRKTAITRECGGGGGGGGGAIWLRATLGAPGVNAPRRDVFQRSGGGGSGAGGRIEGSAPRDSPASARAQEER